MKKAGSVKRNLLRLLGDCDSEYGSSSIRQRATLFFLLFAMLLVVSIGFFSWKGRQDAEHIEVEWEQVRVHILSELVELRGNQMVTFTYDYSYWTQLVDFMAAPDLDWAAENIDPSLETYSFEALIILNLNHEIIYSKRAFDTLHIAPPLMPYMSSKQWEDSGYFLHFFEMQGNDLHEYAISPVQRQRSDSINGEISGYLVAMREWDDDQLAFIESTTGGHSSLIKDTVEPAHANYEGILCSVPLIGVNGTPVAWMKSELRPTTLSDLKNGQRITPYVLFGVTLILLLGGGFLIHSWFLKPLDALQKSLELKNPDLLNNLEHHPREISSSLKLLQDLLIQQDSLKTEVKLRERAEAEAIYRSDELRNAIVEKDFVLDQAKVALYRHDTDGHFHFFSPGIKTITGYEPSELMRHYSYLMTDNPMNAIGMRITERAMETGLPQDSYTLQIRRKDGSLGHMEIAEVPYFDGTKVAGIVGVCRDITVEYEMRLERDRLTASVEKSKRMESIVVLAGGVAHDLNNTLGPLVSYPALLREQLDPQSKGYRYLNTMEQAARQAAEVVKDLLILARRGRLNFESGKLSAIVHEAVNSTAVQDRLKDFPMVTIHTDIMENEPPIMASVSHLVRSVQNLVVNAIDAIESEGSITVSVSSRTDLRTNPASKHEEERQVVVLSVIDTGVGIREDQMSKIFEPYFSTKEMGRSGSGIGLALVHSIVRDHGGYHEISSVVGKGTTFSLVIPASATPETKTTLSSDKSCRNATILVVDDLAIQRDLLKTILESRGHEVVTAGSTKEALEIYRDRGFDFALLDMILEERTDGADLYASLLAIRSPLPCVIVSGFGPSHRMDYALQLGAHGILTKPYTISQLEETIQAVLEKSVNGTTTKTSSYTTSNSSDINPSQVSSSLSH